MVRIRESWDVTLSGWTYLKGMGYLRSSRDIEVYSDQPSPSKVTAKFLLERSERGRSDEQTTVMAD